LRANVQESVPRYNFQVIDEPRWPPTWRRTYDRRRSEESRAGIAPYGVKQVIPAEDPPWVAGQVVEQAELGRGSGGELAAPSIAWHWRR